MPNKRKILFIINPISGTGKKKVVESLLSEMVDGSVVDYEIKYTERAGHAIEISKEVVESQSHEAVVAVGGDGSVNEVSKGLIGSNIKLGILPAVIGPYGYRKLGSAEFRRLSMLASRVGSEEGLRIGWLNEVVDSPLEFDEAIGRVVADVMTTGPMAVAESKKLAMIFDTWNAGDDELRLWTLDKTSQMRGSREGQEGLSSFLERRKPDWVPEE